MSEQNAPSPKVAAPLKSGGAPVIKFGEAAEAILGRSDDDSPFVEFVNPTTGKTFVLEDTYLLKAILDHLGS